MKQFLLLIVFALLLYTSPAQPSDFIVIKKRGVTFKTFFTGAYITFQTNTGDWYSSRVTDIRNDSLFFREVVVRQVPTQWGVSRLDTMTNFTRKVYYKDITAIPRNKESFRFIKNGTLFMLGSGGYILLNIVNSGYLHYAILGKENLPELLTAVGVFGIGFLMHKLYKPYLHIGKKYRVEYVKLNAAGH